MRTLITYYSESGSTKEIAEEISRTIVCEKIKQGNYLNKSDVATWSNTIFNS